MEEQEQKTRLSEIELVNKLNFLRKRIMTMEWDKKQNQLNAGLEETYDKMKKEYEELKQKLQQSQD